MIKKITKIVFFLNTIVTTTVNFVKKKEKNYIKLSQIIKSMYTYRAITKSITIYKGISLFCPHFKISILPFKYNNLLNF